MDSIAEIDSPLLSEPVERLAKCYSSLQHQLILRYVVADCDKDRQLFGDDFMHINQEGHDLVYSKIRAMLTDWPEPAAPSIRVHPDMRVQNVQIV
eukprot:scaffold3097_cov119-Isochrysis_galbana.AAC.2